MSIPRASLILPLGSFEPIGSLGSLGLAYWQRFQRKFSWSQGAPDPVEVAGEGGAFEVVAGWGWSPPLVRGLAFGAAYHKLLGSDRVIQSSRWSGDTSYTVKDTVESRRDGDYVGLSAYWTRGRWDVGTWWNIEGDLASHRTRGITGQFSQPESVWNTSTPPQMGLSMGWRMDERNTWVADYSYTDWTKSISKATPAWKLGAGWQWQGNGDRFDTYWKQMAYRLGGWYQKGGILDPTQAALTSGFGLPLGNNGNLDLSFQLGTELARPAEEGVKSPRLQETFLRVYVSLTGANRWGQSLRRR